MGAMRLLIGVVLATGCTFAAPAASDAPVGLGDAVKPDGAPLGDAALLGPWGVPVPVTELNSTANDDDPTLTGDLLEIYFGSQRGGTQLEDIFVATRASSTDSFGAPRRVVELSSSSFDSNVDIASNGLTIVFSSGRGNGGPDLYFSSRPDRNTAWAIPVLVPGLSSPFGEFGAVLSADLLSALLCSDRMNNDEAIYVSTRASAAASFDPPVKLAGVDTTRNECDAMQPEPTTVYFTRDNADTLDLDLTVATQTAGVFDAGTAITELNTAGRDGDPWVSADQRTMYFASSRPSLAGPDDIFVSTR